VTTVVLQSWHARRDPAWIARCMASVEAWTLSHGYAYRFLDDALFDRLPEALAPKLMARPAMAADLARLLLAGEVLSEGAERVVWFDADSFIFAPDRLILPDAPYAFGREIWIQPGARGRPRIYRNIHNAACLFDAGNPALEFLIEAAARIAARLEGPASPQLLGPKLLTALHNIVAFPLIETAGAASPLVLRDLAAGGGPALEALRAEPPLPAVLNLCASLVGRQIDGVAVDEALIESAMTALAEGAL
jgi:hypothetical protein